MKLLPRIASILLISVSLFILIANLRDTGSGPKSFADCKLFFSLFQQWWAGKAPLYPPLDPEHLAPGTAVYRFPPLWAVTMVPLVQNFELLTAIQIWGFYSLFVFFCGLLLVLWHLKVPLLSPQTGVILLILSLLGPFYETYFGPTHELEIAGLLAVAFVLSERDIAPWGAAAAFALAITHKVYPLLFAFYFLLNRKYRMLLYSMICCAGFNLIPVFFKASHETSDYFFKMLPLLGGSSSYAENAGAELLLMAWRWREWFNHGQGPLDLLSFNHLYMNLWRVFVCLSFAALFIKAKSTPVMRCLLFSTWAAGVLVIMPVAWDNYQVLLIFPAIAFVLRVFEKPFSPVVVIAFLLFLIPLSLMSTLFGQRLLHTYEEPNHRSEMLAATIGDVLYKDLLARTEYRTTHPDQNAKSKAPGLIASQNLLKTADPSSAKSAEARFRRDNLTNEKLIALLALRSFAGCMAFLALLFSLLLVGEH